MMTSSHRPVLSIIFAFLVAVFLYCGHSNPRREVQKSNTSDSVKIPAPPATRPSSATQQVNLFVEPPTETAPLAPLEGSGLSSRRWRDDHGLDTYFSFLVHSGHHNQHLAAMYATTIAGDLGLGHLLVPHMCGRKSFDKSFLHTKYLEMPVSDVYDVSELVRRHKSMFGIEVHVLENGPGRKSKCGRSAVARELPPPRDGSAVGGVTLNVTFDGGAEIHQAGSWTAWVKTFWTRHEDDIRRQLVQVGVLREGQSVADLPVVANGGTKRINIHVRTKNRQAWGMLSLNCKDTRYKIDGFCLHQPAPYTTLIRAARAWPYSRSIVASATELQEQLGNTYGFFHLRAEADNIWSSRDYMLARLKAAVEQHPDMNWYVASGIFNPRSFPSRVNTAPEPLRPAVQFLHKVNGFRARRHWCSLVRPGKKCGSILVGDELNPSLSSIPVELRSCIDQLVGRGADVVAGLSQSSLMGVLHGYRVLEKNTTRTIYINERPSVPATYVDHITFLPWYDEEFFALNGIDRRKSSNTFPVIEHTLHGRVFLEPDLR